MSNGAADMIIIHLEASTFTAEFLGPKAHEVNDLFGTCVLPTPFTEETPARTVPDDLQRLNPGCDVFLCDCTLHTGLPRPATGFIVHEVVQ